MESRIKEAYNRMTEEAYAGRKFLYGKYRNVVGKPLSEAEYRDQDREQLAMQDLDAQLELGEGDWKSHTHDGTDTRCTATFTEEEREQILNMRVDNPGLTYFTEPRYTRKANVTYDEQAVKDFNNALYEYRLDPGYETSREFCFKIRNKILDTLVVRSGEPDSIETSYYFDPYEIPMAKGSEFEDQLEDNLEFGYHDNPDEDYLDKLQPVTRSSWKWS